MSYHFMLPARKRVIQIGGFLAVILLILLMPLSFSAANSDSEIIDKQPACVQPVAWQDNGAAAYEKISALSASPAPIIHFPDTLDYVFGGIDIVIIGVMAVWLIPYIAGMLYIRKHRKTMKRIKELKELVAKLYEFQ